jgi:L-asparaginase
MYTAWYDLKMLVTGILMKIHFFTTGGTLDKIYFDANSQYEVGEPIIEQVLKKMNPAFEFEVTRLLQKDSLEITDTDRAMIRRQIAKIDTDHIIVTHGTDTIVATAKQLENMGNKRIVLTGAMKPAAFADTDAIFNIGSAIGALNAVPAGAYIMMNGRLYKPGEVYKNYDTQRFEAKPAISDNHQNRD